jgi:ArsR family transcriptional regulator
MAHPTRLFIVDLLARDSKCVRDLTDAVGDDMSTISKHLSVLKNAGILDCRKESNQVFYELKMPCVLNFFSCVESVIRASAKEQLAVVKSRNRK